MSIKNKLIPATDGIKAITKVTFFLRHEKTALEMKNFIFNK